MLLIEAVQQGRTRQLKLLIKVGIDLNQTDELGQTALMHSCFVEDDRQRKIATRALAMRGSDINKRDIFGRSALSWACLYGREDVVDFLLNSAVCFDIEVDVSDKDGNSTLLLAVMSNSFPVVKLVVRVLKESGNCFHMHRANDAGISPLVLAFLRGDKICAEFLIKEGGAPVSSVLHYLRRSDVREPLPMFCPTQVAWLPKCAMTSTRSPRRQQTKLISVTKFSDEDVLQFLFDETKLPSSSAGKETAKKKSVYEGTSARSKRASTSSESGPFNEIPSGVGAQTCEAPSSDSNLTTNRSESKSLGANNHPEAKKIPYKPTRNPLKSCPQEPPILKLLALYSDVHSPSYRQGYPDIHYQPAQEIVEEPIDDAFDGSRSARTSVGSILSTGDFTGDADVKESAAMDRHLRLKYARTSRATSLQVGTLPPIGLPGGFRSGRMKRTRSSTTIKRF